jgi:hypothetical protein
LRGSNISTFYFRSLANDPPVPAAG